MYQYTPKDIKRFLSKVAVTDSTDDCWEWLAGFFSEGYGRFKVGGKAQGSHRVAWNLTYGDIPDNIQVLHTCDNRKCVNPSHLFLGTISDNMHDKFTKGRQAVGENHGLAKITYRQAEAIRLRYATGKVPYRVIAAEYGISQATVSQVILLKTWTK